MKFLHFKHFYKFLFISLINIAITQDVITFSRDSGFYPTEFTLILTSLDDSPIYYTTDGNDPTNSNTSKVYTEPIKIKDRTEEPNIYSNYDEDENSPISICRGLGYKKPNYLVEKGMIIRAVAKNDQGFSKIYSKSYFITTGLLSQYAEFIVISLVINPDDLFDPEKGIYVTGNQFIDWKNSEKYDPNKNVWDKDNVCNYFCRGSEWEREANIAIFKNGKPIVEQNVGIRIKGSSTRNLQHKNFNVYARKKYGKGKIKSDLLFPKNYDINGKLINQYDSICLRSVSDEERSFDQFSNRLIHDRKLQSTTEMQNSVLFLNGEFWGMYVITEKYSNEFFSSHYGLLKENILYIKEDDIKEGDPEEYTNLINFMDLYSKKDLSDSNNYEDVCNLIDINSLIEHYATNLYLATYDWPNHNFGMWKYNGDKIKDNLYSEGKWRFMTYDLDYTVGNNYADFGGVEGYQYDTFKHIDKAKNEAPTNLFVSLLKNEKFKSQFKTIYKEYASNVMSLDRVSPIIQEFYGEVATLISYSQARWWGYIGGSRIENIANSKNNYQNKILPKMKKFFEMRVKYTLQQMIEYLNEK